MASSRFWKEREEEFRRHANDENNSLAAESGTPLQIRGHFAAVQSGGRNGYSRLWLERRPEGSRAIWELTRVNPGSTPYGMESTVLSCGSATEEHTTRSVWII